MWIDIAITLSCAGAGLVCGWVMHEIGVSKQDDSDRGLLDSSDAPLVADPSAERVTTVAKQLKEYAISMAADVDAHQTKVQAVNNTLNKGGRDTSPEVMFAAVRQLIESNEMMQSQLQQAQDQIQEQTVQIESAERRAETDALTQIPNRRAFDRHIAHQHSLGSEQAGTLAILDVDHFKKFNDTYGHRAGDAVLRVVAQVLYARLQPYGLVARFGGEEFAVILDGCPMEKAKFIVDQARQAIGQRIIQFEDQRLQVAASVGVAELTQGEAVEGWLQRADDGLYRSKEAGRDCGHWMNGTTPRRIEALPFVDGELVVGQANGGAEAGNADPVDGELANDELAGGELANDELADGDSDPTESGEAEEVEEDGESAFGELPDIESLGEAFGEIRNRTQESVSIHVMAVVCSDSLSKSAVRSLVQVVRATLRSVDRIGSHDDSTLLICMPSADDETARQRGEQICRSAEAIGLVDKSSGQRAVSVGLAEANPNEDFLSVVSRAAEVARESQSTASEAVFADA